MDSRLRFVLALGILVLTYLTRRGFWPRIVKWAERQKWED